MTNGEVPQYIAQLVELEQQIGDKFIFKPKFDATIARAWLGLMKNSPPKLPDAERLRLANLLRRTENISDGELEVLGMVAKSLRDTLARVQENREQNQPPPSRYDPLPFRNRTDW